MSFDFPTVPDGDPDPDLVADSSYVTEENVQKALGDNTASAATAADQADRDLAAFEEGIH